MCKKKNMGHIKTLQLTPMLKYKCIPALDFYFNLHFRFFWCTWWNAVKIFWSLAQSPLEYQVDNFFVVMGSYFIFKVLNEDLFFLLIRLWYLKILHLLYSQIMLITVWKFLLTASVFFSFFSSVCLGNDFSVMKS